MGDGWLRVVRDVGAGGLLASELAGCVVAMRGSLVAQWVGSAASGGSRGDMTFAGRNVGSCSSVVVMCGDVKLAARSGGGNNEVARCCWRWYVVMQHASLSGAPAVRCGMLIAAVWCSEALFIAATGV